MYKLKREKSKRNKKKRGYFLSYTTQDTNKVVYNIPTGTPYLPICLNSQ